MSKEITPKQLRNFGLIVGGIFALISLWPLLFSQTRPHYWLLTLSGLLILLGLLRPQSLGPVHRGWMAFGHVMGRVNTRILLGLGFYGIVTPMGLGMRLLGKDPMRRKFDPDLNTYRIERASRPGSHMQRQF